MEEFNIAHSISFTPSAAAVLSGKAFHLTQDRLRSFVHMQTGDVVQIEDCSAAFVAIGRRWKVGPSSETFVLLLDLLPDETALRAVK